MIGFDYVNNCKLLLYVNYLFIKNKNKSVVVMILWLTNSIVIAKIMWL